MSLSSPEMSFDQLCALQKKAIAELNQVKEQCFENWAPQVQRDFVKVVAEVWGPEVRAEIIDGLFYPPQGNFIESKSGEAFLASVNREFGDDATAALEELIQKKELPILPHLDRIAASGNSEAIELAAATILGMSPGVGFNDRPFEVYATQDADQVLGSVTPYGGEEVVKGAPQPVGKEVLLEMSGEGWTRTFAFKREDLARQALINVCGNTGEMVLGNRK